jgi:SAM-dependent methyltransferase
MLICDLCGGTRFEPCVTLVQPTSLRSDRVIVPTPLHKVACAVCGLVRSGDAEEGPSLDAHYRDEYGTATDEHVFYDASGPRSRSAVIADWMAGALPRLRSHERVTALEIGAGAGLLLGEMQCRLGALIDQRPEGRRMPDPLLMGVELNAAARAAAMDRGVDVRGSLDGIPPADLAWSVAVVEHVASPAAFLREIRSRLRGDGCLILIQPTADVPSYDVLFVDHRHHFSAVHLAAYARKCGFEQVSVEVGHPLMPNFSRHLWHCTPDAREPRFASPVRTAAGKAAESTMASMAVLDSTLERLRGENRRVATFGLQEVYALARAYSAIDMFPLVCGLDDQPARHVARELSFPVVRPEEAPALGITDVVLTMNAIYYPMARARCAAMGLTCHAVLPERPEASTP